MKIFIDTEFKEQPGSIKLISFGAVTEDNHQFYAENSEFLDSEYDAWLEKNVKPHLKFKHNAKGENFCNPMISLENSKSDGFDVFGSPVYIGRKFIDWLHLEREEMGKHKEKIEFYGWYADYDWVVFCWMFGRMIDLPSGFPMYCRDLKQIIDILGNPRIPESLRPRNQHNALDDAVFTKRIYDWLVSIAGSANIEL